MLLIAAGVALLGAAGLYSGYVLYQQHRVAAFETETLVLSLEPSQDFSSPAELDVEAPKPSQDFSSPPELDVEALEPSQDSSSLPKPDVEALERSQNYSWPPELDVEAFEYAQDFSSHSDLDVEALEVEPIEEPPVFLPTAPVTRFAPAESSAPVANEPPTLAPPALAIRIPSIGVDVGIVEVGTTRDEKGRLIWETPKHAAGHYRGTSNPGEAGNLVLSGHISSPIKREGNVFSRLPQLKLGEEVVLETVEGLYIYRVVTRRLVEPSEVDVMGPTSSPVVTLITCYPDWVYTHRLVLTAVPVGFQDLRG